MKYFKWILFITVVVLLFSCAGSKNAILRSHIMQNAKETNQDCFVIFKDGKLEHYKSIKVKTGILVTPYLLADGIKIYSESIEAYQTKIYYAISQKSYSKDDHSKIAAECMPGFAIRITKGKLNVYEKRCLNSELGSRDIYLQSGNDGPVYEYTPEIMNAMIKHNYEAYNYFNQPAKTKLINKVYTAAELYNNGPSYSKQ